MKWFVFFSVCLLAACSSLIPYKDQGLSDLTQIAQSPQTYAQKVVSFTGDVKGTTEDTHTLRLVLKVDTPLYYYATGQDPLSYQLILVEYTKEQPEMTGILKGHHLKILARVGAYEVRKGSLGQPIGVLHLNAFALSDRTMHKDQFHQTAPDYPLYQSWAAGKLFYQEQPEELIKKFPATSKKQLQKIEQKKAQKTADKQPEYPSEIVFEEAEDFTLTPTEIQTEDKTQ